MDDDDDGEQVQERERRRILLNFVSWIGGEACYI